MSDVETVRASEPPLAERNDGSLDAEACYRALCARDRRFDGLFFTAVKSTGIYCRPICPARTPSRRNCEFFRWAAEAERAGYRACFRCRPERAPGGASVDLTSRHVREAVSLIESGYLNEHSVTELADRLGISARHVRRQLERELGVRPVELAQTVRLALAKQLLHDTDLPVARVAEAAGFRSVRRLNAVFQATFSRTPLSIRRRGKTRGGEGTTLRLEYRAPFDWAHLLAFFRGRGVPGVVSVCSEEYQRSVCVRGRVGVVRVRNDAEHSALLATVSPELVPCLSVLAPGLRRLFDLDARPQVTSAHLAHDARLAKAVAARPGLRIPGSLDSFELGVRAIVGQQVSVSAATTVAGRLAHVFGTPLPEHLITGEVTQCFPSAQVVAQADLAAIQRAGMPNARARTIQSYARAYADGALSPAGVQAKVEALQSLPGIGPWTAQYITMRSGWPNAFPAGDLVIQRALGVTSARAAEKLSRAWEPWRSYAAMHLWGLAKEGAK